MRETVYTFSSKIDGFVDSWCPIQSNNSSSRFVWKDADLFDLIKPVCSSCSDITRQCFFGFCKQHCDQDCVSEA